jgi:hypothetical protein
MTRAFARLDILYFIYLSCICYCLQSLRYTCRNIGNLAHIQTALCGDFYLDCILLLLLVIIGLTCSSIFNSLIYSYLTIIFYCISGHI